MIRIFAKHQTATEGAHWHIVATASNMPAALRFLNLRWTLSASYGRDLYFDRGFGTDFCRLAPTL